MAFSTRLFHLRFQQPRHFLAIFIPAPGEVDDDDLILRHFSGNFSGLGEGVGSFQGGQDPFAAGEELEGFEGFGIGDAGVFDAAGVFPVGVLGADAGVVEAGADGVDIGGLAVFVLEDVGHHAVQDTGFSLGESGGVLTEGAAAATGFNADHAD